MEDLDWGERAQRIDGGNGVVVAGGMAEQGSVCYRSICFQIDRVERQK
jgi:hypothetical protein